MFFSLSYTNVPQRDLPSTNAIIFVTVHRHSKPACHTALCSIAIEPDVINLLTVVDKTVKKDSSHCLSDHFLPAVCSTHMYQCGYIHWGPTFSR